MLQSAFAKLIFSQAVAATIVVIVLKKILDKKLIDVALYQFEGWQKEIKQAREEAAMGVYSGKQDDTGGQPITFLVIISHKKLNRKKQEMILLLIIKYLGDNVKVSFKIDRGIRGGIIIDAGKKVFDCSLKDRLRQAFP